jgi:hypothetical protein
MSPNPAKPGENVTQSSKTRRKCHPIQQNQEKMSPNPAKPGENVTQSSKTRLKCDPI